MNTSGVQKTENKRHETRRGRGGLALFPATGIRLVHQGQDVWANIWCAVLAGIGVSGADVHGFAGPEVLLSLLPQTLHYTFRV